METKKKKMKVLILSCNTGEGHNMAAKAVRERCAAEGHEAVVLDFLSLGGKFVSSFISNFYIRSAKYLPNAYGFFYNAMLFVSSILRFGRSIIYILNSRIAPKLKRFLEENDFDAVVTTHMFAADALAYLKRRGTVLPPTAMVITDYSWYPFLQETACDHYILPHDDLIPLFAKRLPEETLCPFGLPISTRFEHLPTQEEARAHLGLASNQPIYLVMGGSMGAGRIKSFTKKLSQEIQNGEIIVICGKNARLKRALEKRLAGHENVRLVGFTDKIPYYMTACDVLYTKPGGLTSTEALVCHTPMVHTTPIPGCETDNMKFFRDHGIAIPAKTVKQQIECGKALAENPERLEEMRACQRRVAKPDSAKDVVRLLEESVAQREAADQP